jgi:aldose 1-epimerase
MHRGAGATARPPSTSSATEASTSGHPPPTGRQFELAFDGHLATVTEVGATLRTYTVEDRDVLDGFALDERASTGRGQLLAPWPNRLDMGSYAFEGREAQAPLDEPGRRNAIHGLVRWQAWTLLSHTADEVTLAHTIHPQPAYPWHVELRVQYLLTAEGLTVTTGATNRSETAAPFGLGFHPYLTVGTETVADAALTLPARVRLTTDDRGLPTGEEKVAGTEYDFTSPHRIGEIQLDTAYGDLARDDDGIATIRLDGPNGRVVSVWLGDAFRWVMAFTGDTVEPEPKRRRGIAIEPMTCPPNALATGTDVIGLEPHAPWQGAWGLSPG